MFDKLVNSLQLEARLRSLAEKIRRKGGKLPSGKEKFDFYGGDFDTAVDSIPVGSNTKGDTVTADSMIKGTTAHDSAGNPITGTMPNMVALTYSSSETDLVGASGKKYHVGPGEMHFYMENPSYSPLPPGAEKWFSEGQTVYVTMPAPRDGMERQYMYTQAMPDGTKGGLLAFHVSNLVSDNIRAGITILGRKGTFASDGSTQADHVLAGDVVYTKDGRIVGTAENHLGDHVLSTRLSEAKYPQGYTIKPGLHSGQQEIRVAKIEDRFSADQIGAEGLDKQYNDAYCRSLHIDPPANLSAQNIRAGVTLMGVQGLYTNDANVNAEDIAYPKTAYVGGRKISGSAGVPVKALTATEVSLVDGKVNMALTIKNHAIHVYSNNRLAIEASTTMLGNATADHVEEGYTYTGQDGVKKSGRMKPGANTSDATAAASDIREGRTAYISGGKKTGTMKTLPNAISSPSGTTSPVTGANGSTIFGAATPSGFRASMYSACTYSSPSGSGGCVESHIHLGDAYGSYGAVPIRQLSGGKYGFSVYLEDANLKPENIRQGVVLFGIRGTYRG